MKFKIKYADKIVGIFTIIGVLFISLLLVFMGINQRWFAKNYYYTTRFLSADGIRPGMPIKYRGFQIGQINRVSLNKNNEVEVDLFIFGEYIEIITPNTIIQKIVSPIGLGSDILIHPGPPTGGHIPENSFIPSLNLPEARALIEAGFVDIPVDTTITNIIEQVSHFLDSLDRVVKGEETISTGKIVKNFEEITSDIATVFSQTSEEIEGIIKDLNIILNNLSDPNNSITAITSDNRELYDNIDGILTNLNNITKELNSFANFMNRSTPQVTGVLEESRGALREGTAVMEGLKNNPLLRGGITQQKEQESSQFSIRQEEF